VHLSILPAFENHFYGPPFEVVEKSLGFRQHFCGCFCRSVAFSLPKEEKKGCLSRFLIEILSSSSRRGSKIFMQ